MTDDRPTSQVVLAAAERLTAAGQPPRVQTAGAVVGKARATEMFESAYDEHGRRMARMYAELGAR